MVSPIGGSQLAGFCCYEAVVLHNTPAELVQNGPVSSLVKRRCGRAPAQGIIPLSGHNGVAIRFRIIKSSEPSLSLAAWAIGLRDMQSVPTPACPRNR